MTALRKRSPHGAVLRAMLGAMFGLSGGLAALEAHAGPTIPFGEDKSVSVGFGAYSGERDRRFRSIVTAAQRG
jgi:hypothetical protein